MEDFEWFTERIGELEKQLKILDDEKISHLSFETDDRFRALVDAIRLLDTRIRKLEGL